MKQVKKISELNQSGSMPKAVIFTLLIIFSFASISLFKQATTHAYAVSSNSIKSGLPGDCLNVENNNDSPGAIVDVSKCISTDSENWTVSTITIKHAGLCLSVDNNSNKVEAGIVLAKCNTNAPGQVWLNNDGRLYNPNASTPNSHLCISDPGRATGEQLILATCDNQADQKWSSPMLTPNCSSITGEGPRVACYAELDYEIWTTNPGKQASLMNTYTDGAPYEEWCADFVSYVYKQAGYAFSGGYQGWDDSNANNIQNEGFIKQSTSFVPSPGDVGHFNYTGGHVEIVISGGPHPTFIYGDSATIDPLTRNGQMEANTIVYDGKLGQITYYLTPTNGS